VKNEASEEVNQILTDFLEEAKWPHLDVPFFYYWMSE